MLGDFLVDFYRPIEIEYNVNEEKKKRTFYVKGISLNDLGEMFADEEVGFVILKAIEGIDLKKENEETVKKTFVNLIDTKYALAVYKIIAQCLYIKDENGEHISCKNDYLILDKIPAHIVIQFLNNIVELSLPGSESKLRTEIKKLISLLTTKANN